MMQKTQVWPVDAQEPAKEKIEQAAEILRQGGLVAFPTETVYGLGANGLDEAAVKKIFQAKGRPADNPLILHIADLHEVVTYSKETPVWVSNLVSNFWPGPLSVVLKRASCVPDAVTAGLDTVAVRLPDSPTARALIRAAGVPLAAPSANVSGRPSPTSANMVLQDLDGKIDGVLDAGPCAVGLESTVLDCTGAVPVILRPGGVTQEMLESVLGKIDLKVERSSGSAETPRSPGMKYRHYAPDASLHVVEAGGDNQGNILLQAVQAAMAGQQRVGVVVSAETAAKMPSAVVTASYGSRKNPAECAAGLYRALRVFDTEKVDVIFAEGLPEDGIGCAFMNRLRKASVSTLEG